MRICNLGSGSSGNITYIESENSKILIDAGYSCKEISERLALLKVNPESLNGILITHEHTDHIKGADAISAKYNIPIYVHTDGLIALKQKLIKAGKNIIPFSDDFFKINDLLIKSFAIPHDVDRCSGFSVYENEKKISILTDLGHTTNEIINHISDSTLVFLEANHDLNMLYASSYPDFLKRRIASKKGHLSNADSAKAIYELIKSGTRQIVLSHLSEENNSPQIAYEYVKAFLQEHGIVEGEDVKIDVAETRPKIVFKL